MLADLLDWSIDCRREWALARFGFVRDQQSHEAERARVGGLEEPFLAVSS